MVRNLASLSLEYTPDDTVHIRHGVVEGRRISLAVCGDPARGLVLRRRCRAQDEPISVQCIDARDRNAVAEFVGHDPYAVQLSNEYRAVLAVLDEHAANAVPGPEAEFASECGNDGELSVLMRRICVACGATHCFYHWFTVEENTGELVTHDLLVGGAPGWAQHYVHRHWHLNDPAIVHARDDTRPLLGSSLDVLPADHWLNRQARQHSMYSHVFFPAHRRDVPMFGLLHASASSDGPHGEEQLWSNRRQLRGLADELLEWQVLRQRRELADALSLEHREVLALRLVAHGGSARHVAEELKIGERAVYQLFGAINRKLDCEHIKVSATKAKHLGLLTRWLIPK